MIDERDREQQAPALPWLPLLPWQFAAARAMLRGRGSWPPALLIHGRRGIGKHALALNVAQGLLCESPQDDGLACGQCASCRYAIAGQHPDLLRLELLEFHDEAGEYEEVDTITVKRIRLLIDFAQVTSHRQKAKVAVIAPAERMNLQAANALLKTLEEPPPGTYLILVADQPGSLPATIQSRCRKEQAPFPDAQAARAWLATQGVADPATVLAQAAEAPLIALELADAGLQSERRIWLSMLGKPSEPGIMTLAARVDGGAREERRARLGRSIDWLLSWTADLARVAMGGTARQNPDYAREIDALARRLALPRLFRYHDRLLRHRALLVHPLQPRLVAEAALIEYKGLFSSSA